MRAAAAGIVSELWGMWLAERGYCVRKSSQLVVLCGGTGCKRLRLPGSPIEHENAASDQRAPRSGLQLKRFYKGHRVHGVWPRGTMVGSGEGAGRVRATTRVVGHCRKTDGWVRTHETKRNERRGTYC